MAKFDWYKVTRRVDDSGTVMGQVGILLDDVGDRYLMYFPQKNSLHNNSSSGMNFGLTGSHCWFVYKEALTKI